MDGAPILRMLHYYCKKTMTAPRLVEQDVPSPCLHVVTPLTPCLTHAVLGNGLDGIVVLSATGEWIHSNALGREIYHRITKAWPHSDPVPAKVWAVCQILFQRRHRSDQTPTVAESEIELPQSRDRIRIRARWLYYGQQTEPYILLILENQTSSQQNLAITEAIRYQLSPREADVWRLHRMGYRYQEIAEELHIALNTVKKHMKSTYAKQQVARRTERPYANGLAS